MNPRDNSRQDPGGGYGCFPTLMICALALVLAACAGAGVIIGQTGIVTQPLKVICLPMVEYSAADQAAFAAEVAALDPAKNPQVIRFLGDYKAMRDANRACHAHP